MHRAFWILLAALALPAHAAEMVPIPTEQAYCGKTDAYCYEWKFERDPSLRFVATGYEDGGGFYFYRRSAKGAYRMLFAVYPAMTDASYPGQLFWGYAWDIQDIVLSSANGKAFEIQAAFDHGYEEDGNWAPPEEQRSVPFVLFKGATTQPNMKLTEPLRFRRLSVDAVQRHTRLKTAAPTASPAPSPAASAHQSSR